MAVRKPKPVEHELVTARETIELQRAQLNAALCTLRDVLGILASNGGYLEPEHQMRLRRARALLAEQGVRLPED